MITIYRLDNGKPVCRGDGISIPDNCVAVDGCHDLRRTALHISSDDLGETIYTVVPILPPRPADDEHYTWEWSETADAWVSEPTLLGHKLGRWSLVKVWREQAETAPFAVDGRSYDADKDSQRRIAGAVQLASLAGLSGQGWAVDWTLADNSVVTLDASQIYAVGVALGQHVAAAHATARTLRLLIDEAASVSAVQSIAWPTP